MSGSTRRSSAAPTASSPRHGLQVDVIRHTGTDYFTSNIEDGIALADDDLRARFANRYPEAWARIEARRAFMRDRLGIRLKPEVLLFSNIPAWLPPSCCGRGFAMTMATAAWRACEEIGRPVSRISCITHPSCFDRLSMRMRFSCIFNKTISS